MREISRLVLGMPKVVDGPTKATLERWGLEGATKVQENPKDVTGEIERLVGREEAAYRQTLLVDWEAPGFRAFYVWGWPEHPFLAGWDLLGRLLVRRHKDPPHLPEVGRQLYDETVPGVLYTISHSDRLYMDEALAGLLCSVETSIDKERV